MQKSARILGEEFRLTAAQMNFLLRDEGFLEGSPGKWVVTDKGAPFANEQDHKLGTGGYASYNRNWGTLTWDENITSEMDFSGERRQKLLDTIREEKRVTASASLSEDVPEEASGDPEANWLVPVVFFLALGTIYGITKAAPRLKALWKDKAGARIANRKSGESREPAEVRSEIDDDQTDEGTDPRKV
jgi:hypothetical protein